MSDPLARPDQVLEFWMTEAGPAKWYLSDPDFDAEIRDRFLASWQAGTRGDLHGWAKDPEGALALIILLDQFPRNMFRGSGDSFASDALARKTAKQAIEHGWDLRISAPGRSFFYLPLMHSESLVDQDRCVRLVLTRMPDQGGSTLLHARAHREVIREFGRFPYRNQALGRVSRPAERAYIDQGGYGLTVRKLQQQDAEGQG